MGARQSVVRAVAAGAAIGSAAGAILAVTLVAIVNQNPKYQVGGKYGPPPLSSSIMFVGRAALSLGVLVGVLMVPIAIWRVRAGDERQTQEP